jgi:hypothetical protein
MLRICKAALVGGAMSSVVAFASGIDTADVTVFEEGAPAEAASINANFQALVNAINASAEKIAVHEERIAALELNSVPGGSATVSNSVAGHSYQFYGLGVIHRVGSNGYVSVNNYSQEFVLTFSEDGTATVNGRESEAEVGFAVAYDEPNNAWKLDGSLKKQSDNAPVSGSGLTYEQSGSSVSIPGMGAVLTVSIDGRVMIKRSYEAGPESATFEYGESSILIGVQVQ